MRAPTATYRMQLNRDFTFNALKDTVPYLAALGISHIYASPIFKAKPGSMHGYDIVDPNSVSEELGGQSAFEELTRTVAEWGLEWLQDIVPNHQSYSLSNEMVYDLMEKGADSRYGGFLDVDWNYPSQRLRGKILVPFLEKSYAECLRHGQISLVYDNGFTIKYGNMEFPVNAHSTETLQKNGSIKQTIKRYNSDPALIAALLSTQFYLLAHWEVALKQINYRRFFDIIDLIGTRMENPEAFEETHRLIFQLLTSGNVSALRIDHVDGLFEPEAYLRRLRELLPDTYMVVEKILTVDEDLPDLWPVQGTTGYDFLNYVNKLFIQQAQEDQFDLAYRRFTGNTQAFSDLLYDSKKFVVVNYFLGEVRNLARLIYRTLRKLQYDANFSRDGLKAAVVELLACFPVYRTYLNPQSQCEDAPFKLALELAGQRNPKVKQELAAIAHLLKKSKNSNLALRALMRFQQFTGAVMAKGFEDTALYRYNRFLSLNEVGGNPAQFGCKVEEFHGFNRLRQQKWPLSLNATSTHDTKRGEDVRARLNVLSEIPNEWQSNILEWSKLNAAKKRQINGKPAPDANEEYCLYQTLLGVFPWDMDELNGFTDRLKLHMVKALREAKTNSNWLSPNKKYEETVTAFVADILSSKEFLEAFLPLQKKIAYYGFFNTLSQTLLKITCPGIPDFYQGTELWDLNLVDPDNRRPVDFQTRKNMLSEVSRLEPSKAQILLENPADGKAKLYLIYKSLVLRRRLKALFEEGAFTPLAAEGSLSGHVVAFSRQKSDESVVVVVPRFLTQLLNPWEEWNKICWAESSIRLPEISGWTDILTGRILRPHDRRLLISDTLAVFPVAILYSGDVNG